MNSEFIIFFSPWRRRFTLYSVDFDTKKLIVFEFDFLSTKELTRVNRTLWLSWTPKKVNVLVFQKFYLNFAVFLSNFINTYILKEKFEEK